MKTYKEYRQEFIKLRTEGYSAEYALLEVSAQVLQDAGPCQFCEMVALLDRMRAWAPSKSSTASKSSTGFRNAVRAVPKV